MRGATAILTDLLRGELGFDGVVVADYFAVELLITHHHTAATSAGRAAGALGRSRHRAARARLLPASHAPRREPDEPDVALVDRAVVRVLTAKFRLGLFEQPYVDADRRGRRVRHLGERRVARRAAGAIDRAAAQRGRAAPARSGDDRSIAVIGPLADTMRGLQGDYHYPAHTEIVFELEQSSPALLPQAGGALADELKL